MVVIRLARVGRHKYAVYRIVAADKKRAATGKFLEVLGTYNPHTKEITLNKESVEKYMSNGAQASDRVLRLLQKEGVQLPSWAKMHDRNKKPKNVEETSEEKPAGVETAQEEADAVAENADDIKNDVGTAKENDDSAKQAKASEQVAEATQEEAQTEPTK